MSINLDAGAHPGLMGELKPPLRCTARLPSLSGMQVVGRCGVLEFGARGLVLGHCLAPCDLRSLGLGGLPVTRLAHPFFVLVYAAALGEERTCWFSCVNSFLFGYSPVPFPHGRRSFLGSCLRCPSVRARSGLPPVQSRSGFS